MGRNGVFGVVLGCLLVSFVYCENAYSGNVYKCQFPGDKVHYQAYPCSGQTVIKSEKLGFPGLKADPESVVHELLEKFKKRLQGQNIATSDLYDIEAYLKYYDDFECQNLIKQYSYKVLARLDVFDFQQHWSQRSVITDKIEILEDSSEHLVARTWMQVSDDKHKNDAIEYRVWLDIIYGTEIPRIKEQKICLKKRGV